MLDIYQGSFVQVELFTWGPSEDTVMVWLDEDGSYKPFDIRRGRGRPLKDVLEGIHLFWDQKFQETGCAFQDFWIWTEWPPLPALHTVYVAHCEISYWDKLECHTTYMNNVEDMISHHLDMARSFQGRFPEIKLWYNRWKDWNYMFLMCRSHDTLWNKSWADLESCLHYFCELAVQKWQICHVSFLSR